MRDHEIFVRRTLEDGTQAELEDSRHGSTARVTAPDGFSFLADPVTDLSLPDSSSAISISMIWHSPDPAIANKVLADIGARLVISADNGTLFSTKNGGFVITKKGAANAVELEIVEDAESEF
ncbi:hypothetical protein [Arthrobacter psychrolactophilus]